MKVFKSNKNQRKREERITQGKFGLLRIKVDQTYQL